MPPAEKLGTGSLPLRATMLNEFIGRLEVLGGGVELLLGENRERAHFAGDLAHVLHGVNHVAGPGFALGADHGRALGNAPQSLAQVARAANEGGGEGVLVDVVRLVGRSEDFALVDEVHAQLLQNLRFGEVADARLGHHRNGNGLNNLLDQAWARHAGHAALGADHGGHAFQSHHRGCAGLFGDAGLLDAHHVHDDAALEHLRQTDLEAQAGSGKALVFIGFRHGIRPQYAVDSGSLRIRCGKERTARFWPLV